MKYDHSQLDQANWRVIDHSSLGTEFDARDSFAIDDTLCASVGAGVSSAVARLWVHHHTVVLGIQDSRLPHAAKAIDDLLSKGYRVIVRNSGGLAVPLDDGVLNISLVLPVENVFAHIDLGYETMARCVKEMLQPYTDQVIAKEIVGSYCPGRYDLSIGGKKFAGISQRRTKGGTAIQVFLNVTASGKERAHVIKTFYRLAQTGRPEEQLLSVRPETVASLSELLHVDVTIQTLRERLMVVLKRHSERLVITGLLPEEESVFEHNRKRMMTRNEKSLRPLIKQN